MTTEADAATTIIRTAISANELAGFGMHYLGSWTASSELPHF